MIDPIDGAQYVEDIRRVVGEHVGDLGSVGAQRRFLGSAICRESGSEPRKQMQHLSPLNIRGRGFNLRGGGFGVGRERGFTDHQLDLLLKVIGSRCHQNAIGRLLAGCRSLMPHGFTHSHLRQSIAGGSVNECRHTEWAIPISRWLMMALRTLVAIT